MALLERLGANKNHPLSFAFQPFIEHGYCQNKEYQKLYAEYERSMSMNKKERLEAGLDEFTQPPVRKRFLVLVSNSLLTIAEKGIENQHL